MADRRTLTHVLAALGLRASTPIIVAGAHAQRTDLSDLECDQFVP